MEGFRTAGSDVCSSNSKWLPRKSDLDHEAQFLAQEDTDVVFITADKKKIGAHSYMLKGWLKSVMDKLMRW